MPLNELPIGICESYQSRGRLRQILGLEQLGDRSRIQLWSVRLSRPPSPIHEVTPGAQPVIHCSSHIHHVNSREHPGSQETDVTVAP